MERNCFTYLIGWSNQNLWYYGVRYSRKATPESLWVTYFTSSKHVRRVRRLYGEPDIIKIRKVFGDNAVKAKKWEETVLRRLNVRQKKEWLNISRNNSFRGASTSWNEGLTKETSLTLKLTSEKISKTRKGQKASKETKEKMKAKRSTFESRKENIWSQFSDKDVYATYDDLESAIISLAKECWSIPFVIARKLNISEYSVRSVLLLKGFTVVRDQKITKVYNKYHQLFESYESYEKQILDMHFEGSSVFVIAESLKVNVAGVKSLLLSKNLTPIVTKRKTGPKLTSPKTGMKKNTHIWITNSQTSVRHPISKTIPIGWRRGRG